MASKPKSADEKPYGNSRGGYHQITSLSSECDALGHVDKKSQTVRQDAPAVAHPHKTNPKEASFDERLPQPKGAYPGGQTTLRCVNGAKSKGRNHLKERGY